MIQELRRAKPFAHFGHYRQEATIAVGESIDVWLGTLYNLEAYSTLLTGSVPNAKISNYQYRITPDEPGTYTIKYRVDSKDAAKSIIMNSNTLTLTVI